MSDKRIIARIEARSRDEAIMAVQNLPSWFEALPTDGPVKVIITIDNTQETVNMKTVPEQTIDITPLVDLGRNMESMPESMEIEDPMAGMADMRSDEEIYQERMKELADMAESPKL